MSNTFLKMYFSFYHNIFYIEYSRNSIFIFSVKIKTKKCYAANN